MRARCGAVALTLAALIVAIAPMPASAVARLATSCVIDSSHGTFGGSQGIIVDGRCVPPGNGAPSGPAALYREVGCQSDGTAILNDAMLTDTQCDANVPQCQLLENGGQSGRYLIWAYENQVLQPGAATWSNPGFFCPQSTAPVPAGPDVAAIRDQVARLLPRVTPATTGPTTLVNIQTLLWADTPSDAASAASSSSANRYGYN